jgi:serine/threonine protein kinase
VPADSDPGLAELDGMVIVMEYVRGESLGELVRTRGVLDDVAAARVWSSIAGALDAAHAQGVLHRDVKPGNIVLDADGQAHLIDFGIARKTGDATLTATGFVLGTPDFLPPRSPLAPGRPRSPTPGSWRPPSGTPCAGSRRAATTRTRSPGCAPPRSAARRRTCRAGRRT